MQILEALRFCITDFVKEKNLSKSIKTCRNKESSYITSEGSPGFPAPPIHVGLKKGIHGLTPELSRPHHSSSSSSQEHVKGTPFLFRSPIASVRAWFGWRISRQRTAQCSILDRTTLENVQTSHCQMSKDVENMTAWHAAAFMRGWLVGGRYWMDSRWPS